MPLLELEHWLLREFPDAAERLRSRLGGSTGGVNAGTRLSTAVAVASLCDTTQEPFEEYSAWQRRMRDAQAVGGGEYAGKDEAATFMTLSRRRLDSAAIMHQQNHVSGGSSEPVIGRSMASGSVSLFAGVGVNSMLHAYYWRPVLLCSERHSHTRYEQDEDHCAGENHRIKRHLSMPALTLDTAAYIHALSLSVR